MEHQEILPNPDQPEQENTPESLALNQEFTNEAQQAQLVEKGVPNSAGSSALQGTAILGAQASVQGVSVQSVAGQAQSDTYALYTRLCTKNSSVQGVSVQSVAGQAQSDDTAHLTANDVDLIEKEWVRKAKLIVERTLNDPYTQSDELSKAKADYIKKRYGRDVKIKQDGIN